MRQLASLPPKLHLCVLLSLGLGLTLAARAGVFSWPPDRLPFALFLLFWGGLAAGDGRQGFEARSFRLTLGPPAIFLAQCIAGTRAALTVAAAVALADALFNSSGREEREIPSAPVPYTAVFSLGSTWIAVALGGLVYAWGARLGSGLAPALRPVPAGVAWLVGTLAPLTLVEGVAHAVATDRLLKREWPRSLLRNAPSFAVSIPVAVAALMLVQTFGARWSLTFLGSLFFALFALRFYQEKSSATRQVESILSGSKDGVAILKGHSIAYANNAFAEILSRPREQLVGTEYPRYLPIHAAGWSDLSVLAEARQAEWEMQRPDGSLVRVECSVSPVIFHGDECLQIVARDVTARYALQRHAAQSQKLQAMGQMAAGVAHDFNNALMAIVGNLSVARAILSRPSSSAEALEMASNRLKLAEKAAMDAATTVRRLQVYSKPAPDAIEIVEMSDLLREVRLILRPLWHDSARAEGREIRVDVSADPPLPVEASPAELREALINLVTNAVHAMPQGGAIRLGARIDDIDVVVTVGDTGTGMPPDVVERIFEPFFSTKGQKGTGLGLFVTAGIVAHHGGRIEVKSVQGEGTTFTMHFPLAQEKKKEERDELLALPEGTRIFLVEEDERVREAIVGMLETANVGVGTASTASSAVEEMGSERYDAVLTDVALAGMTGMDLARSIRSRYPNLPILMLSGWLGQTKQPGPEESVPDGLISATLSKPLQLGALLQALHEVITPAPVAAARK